MGDGLTMQVVRLFNPEIRNLDNVICRGRKAKRGKCRPDLILCLVSTLFQYYRRVFNSIRLVMRCTTLWIAEVFFVSRQLQKDWKGINTRAERYLEPYFDFFSIAPHSAESQKTPYGWKCSIKYHLMPEIMFADLHVLSNKQHAQADTHCG